jgi:hypothetical protein
MEEVTNLRQELQYLLENVEIFYKAKHDKKVMIYLSVETGKIV